MTEEDRIIIDAEALCACVHQLFVGQELPVVGVVLGRLLARFLSLQPEDREDLLLAVILHAAKSSAAIMREDDEVHDETTH